MPFVYSSWIKCFQEAAQNRALPWHVYCRSQKHLIGELLDGKGCRVLVARSPTEELIIRGYAVVDGPDLHWIYVKSRWRRNGIAAALLAAAGSPTVYTHSHEPGGSRLRSMGLTYNGRLFGG